MSIGLKNGTVKLTPYDPKWVREFEAEKKRLLETFGDKIVAIEHIGSTSIPGMSAKPIIDMNVAIESLDDAKTFIKPLQKLGYEYMPNRWFDDRYFFPKGPESFRTHHLNLVEKTSETAWLNPQLFRDYLINNPEARDAYTELKKKLAGKYGNKREKYTEAKSAFVTDVLAKVKQELEQPPVEIERAVPGDAETICDIRDRAWIKAYPNAELGITAEDIQLNAQGRDGEFVPRRIAYLKKQLAKNSGTDLTTFVAKVDGKVVGYIEPRIDDQKRHCIGSIYVSPENQGMGIGSKLMRHVLDLLGCNQDIFLKVVSYNQNAINFYKHFGFEKSNAVVPEEEGRPDYMKSLPQTEMVLRAQSA